MIRDIRIAIYDSHDRNMNTSMRKSKMSRGDVAPKAQKPVDFDPTSIRTPGKPS